MRRLNFGNGASFWNASDDPTTITYNLADQTTRVDEPATGDTGTGNVHTVNNYIYTGGPLYRADLFDESANPNPARQVSYAYGHEGELLSVTGGTEPVTYTYDAAYNRITLADGNSAVTHYDYEPGTGRLQQIRYPNPDSQAAPYDRAAFTYDKNGRVKTRADGRGQKTTYSYNYCGFVTDIAYTGQSSQNVHIEYDDYNRREYMTDASGRTDYAYDDLNNVATVITDYTNGPQDRTITYAYWPNGGRKTMVSPSGTFDYEYDVVGRLTELTNPFSETTTWAYNTVSRMTHQVTHETAMRSYAYNQRGFMTTLITEQYGGPAFQMPYDASGNRTSMAVTQGNYPGTTNYVYNTKDQLTQERTTRNGGYADRNFAYDDAFNPTTLRSTGSIPYNTNNQRTGSQTYVYDGNGNPTTYKGTTLTYDVENRLTAHGSAMYAGYNGNGLRSWKDNDNTAGNGRTYFLYDGADLLCELNASGTVLATNTWGADGLVSRRVGTTSVFYSYDPQGNVAQRLDSSGNVVSSDLYDAYGSKLAGNPNGDPYGFCGQWGYYTDSETGLILCTFRYYDPTNGRWVTRDPIGYNGGVNLYGYVSGNAPNESDDLGLRRVWAEGKADPGKNTIVCDGRGNVVTQVAPGQSNCLTGCIKQHEESHAHDALSVNPCVCQGMPAGTQVYILPLPPTERKAHDLTESCLTKLILAPTTSRECVKIDLAFLKRIQQDRKKYD